MPGAPSSSSASAARYSVLRPPRPPPLAEHDARLAARQNRRAPAALQRLFREPRVLAAERLRLVVEVVAELHDAEALDLEEARRGRERRRRSRDQVHAVVARTRDRRASASPTRDRPRRCELRVASDSDNSRGCAARRPESSDRASSGPTRSRRRRRRARRRSRTSPRAPDARRRRAARPSSRDRCLRTQLISRMSAPWRIKKFAAARFCSNVSTGSGCAASDEPPPEIRQHQRLVRRAAATRARATARRPRGSRRRAKDARLRRPRYRRALARLQAVAVARDDHAAHGRAPVRVERGRHRRRGLAGAEHERGPARQPAQRGRQAHGGRRGLRRLLERLLEQRARGGRVRHGQPPAARCSNVATAGSFLPSRNSRNAPPPVEM